MVDRKWNNQGGSSRDGSGKGRLKKPSDPFKTPSVGDLTESDVTSFKIVKQRQQQANYGQFGDAVWVPDLIIDVDPIRDLDDPYRFPDLSTDRIDEIKPFPESDNIKKVPIPNPNADFASEFKSKDLLPSIVKYEYELIVKFKKVILTILSGQAYAARNQLNDKKYDSAIVILSDNPIAMSGAASTVNTIQLVNGVQDPIDSLYDWMMTKTKIVTDGTGKNTDVQLLSINRQGAGKRLPETSFTYAGKSYGLFYVSSGIQPYQICMNAKNDVLKFAAGNPKDDKYWSVLNANPPLSLCIANIPTVSIALDPGSASELESGSGMSFVLKVTVDPVQSGDTLVEYEILGTANPVFYTVTGTSFDSEGVPVVNIPNINNKIVSIEPLANPSQTENKTVVFKLKEKDDRYLIDEELVELIILPSSGQFRFIAVGITPDLYYLITHYDRDDKFFYPDLDDIPGEMSVFKAALIIHNPAMISIEDVVTGGNWTVTYLDNNVDKIYRFNQATEDASVPADAVDILPDRSSRVLVPGGRWQLSGGEYAKFSEYNFAPSPDVFSQIDLTRHYGMATLINNLIPAFESTYKTHKRMAVESDGDSYPSESVNPQTLAVASGTPITPTYIQIGSEPLYEAQISGTVGDTIEFDSYHKYGVFEKSYTSTIFITPVFLNSSGFSYRWHYEELRCTILEKEIRSYYHKRIALVGVAGLEMAVIKEAPLASVFELEGWLIDLLQIMYRTNNTTGQIDCNYSNTQPIARSDKFTMAANYQRRHFINPVTTTVKIGNDVVISNSRQIAKTGASIAISGSNIAVTGLDTLSIPGVVVRSEIDTTTKAYPASMPAYTDGNTRFTSNTSGSPASTTVRNLVVNPDITNLKYATIITSTAIYNVLITSLISTVETVNRQDPYNSSLNGNEFAILPVDGLHSSDYGYYPTGHRVVNNAKLKWSVVNPARDWNALNANFRFAIPMSRPATCSSSTFAFLIAYYAPYFPKFWGQLFSPESQSSINFTFRSSTFTAINSPDPECLNTNRIRNITGFNCTVQSTYTIDAPWVTSPIFIMPDPDYFSTDSTLMGRKTNGVIELYKSTSPSSPTDKAIGEKWIVNDQNRFELTNYFKGNISASSQFGNDFSTQYYPY